MKKLSTTLCALFILISFDVNASGVSPENQTVPSPAKAEILTMPESIAACSGKNEGDNCVINENNQKTIGKCEKSKEGKMSCAAIKS